MAWIVALLVLGILHIHLGAAEVSVQRGELAGVNSSRAVLSMSGDTSQKSTWWQFIPHLKSHPEAFLRYLVSIPIPEEELGSVEQVCDKDYLKEIRDRGGLSATRNASIAEYESSEHIKGLGTMKITMWLLAFVCLQENRQAESTLDAACEPIAPVVLRVTPQDYDQEIRNWTRYSPTYFSLWEVVSDNSNAQRVTNTVPSRILEFPTEYYTNTQSESGFQARTLAWESYRDLPNCGNLGFDIFADRGEVALTDKGARLPSPSVRKAPEAGVYNYGGVAKCYRMDEEFKNATGSELLTVLGPAFLPGKIVGGCQSESPFLFSNQSGYYACYSEQLNATVTTRSSWRFHCVHFDCGEKEVKASLVPYFKAVYEAPRNETNTLVPLRRQSCSGLSSIWVRTTNSPSSNFPLYDAPVCENRRAAKPEMCLWGIDPPQDLLQTSSDVDILSSLLSQVKASYIAEHLSLLNLEQGSPAEFWVVAITLPSAFIAVVAGVVPLTDAQLKLVRGVRVSSRLKIGLLCCCNLVLAIVSYSAVVALTPTELQREKSFRSWALHADQVQVTSHGLRVLVVAQGESTYKSNSLLLAWVSTAVLMPVVLLITFLRCRQELRTLQSHRRGSLSGMQLPSRTLKRFLRSYSLI
ncbi:hypothetical protein SELMODRAFT_448565 [Selaginella moellendorffii]|uniref:Uncharacterized protein n=1 Tax=Selaginella moellendorffii TaxID=88036 RepID=D8T870_SELML|nr:hypothetical protein SELMODRAFT_448565 [Selaginella moellendorffii]